MKRLWRWLLDSMASVASETFTSTSAPIQYAAVRAFKGDITIEKYLWHSRRILKVLGKELTRRLRKAGVELPSPEGGFYLFPDFSNFRERLSEKGIETSQEFCNRLLTETGVAMLPGVSFGRPPEELTARIAYVDFDGAHALAADQFLTDSKLDVKFLEKSCNRMLIAVDKICEWVKS